MEPMTIALIVLVVAGVWAVVELALTLRQTRKSVSELTDSVNDTIGEVRPAIAKLDGAIDELQPAVKQIEPILEKAATSVDLINVDLVRVEGILSDVNSVTGTGARVTEAVTGAVEHAAGGVAGVAAKVAGKVTGRQPSKLAGHEDPASLEAPKGEHAADAPRVSVEQVSGDTGYFTYPAGEATGESVAAGDEPAADAAAQPASEND